MEYNYYQNYNYNNNYNQIQVLNQLSQIKLEEEDKNKISQTLKIDNEIFDVVFIKDKYKISIFCNPKEEFICLYEYSIEITYEEFCKLGKTFKLCENIDEIFKIIKNLVEEVALTKNRGENMQSNINIEYSQGDSINLLFKIPLLIGKYEEIKIEFKKSEKDIHQQFKKLKEKYLKIKSMVIKNDINSLRNEFISELGNQKVYNIENFSILST